MRTSQTGFYDRFLILDSVKYRKNISVLDIGFGAGFPLTEIAMRLGRTCKVMAKRTLVAELYEKSPEYRYQDYLLTKLKFKCMSDWKEAISLTLPSEAHMVQGYLESEGIETILKDEMTAQVNNFYSNAVGGVKVMVRDEDYENAQQILINGGYINPEKPQKIELVYLTATTNKKQCPFCHSDNIGKKKSPDVITLIITLLLNVIFPIFKRSDRCFDCGKEWIYKRQK
jgi:hypothetical protein